MGGGAEAAPVGNPSFPRIIDQGICIPKSSWLTVRTGYEGDFVSDARLEQTGGGRVDDFEQQTNSGTLTATILERLDLFGIFGSSRAEADWRISVEEEIRRLEIESDYDFLWGVGARALLLIWGNANLGLGGRYSVAKYNLSWATVDGISQETSGSRLNWDEWQVDLDLSYQIDFMIPYLGIKYSSVRSELHAVEFEVANGGGAENTFKERNPVGAVIGCTISNGKYFLLNVEGRLIDEEAVTVSADLKF
jgi:hypothetical protein